MAGRTDRSSANQTGPVVRQAATRRPQANISRPARVQVPIEVGPAPEPIVSEALVVSSTSPLAHDTTVRQFQTQAAYRRLITSGISSPEAAGLISYVVGLAPCESHWSLLQVNRLLFLRDLYGNTDWGKAERAPVREPD
jgi:hypothetical protein